MSKINLLGRSRRRRRGLRGASSCRTAKGRLKKGCTIKNGRVVRVHR